MEHGRFYKATEVAKIYGMTAEAVRNLCHARGQRFAMRLVFDEFLKRKQERMA